jgi:hypothetical protein
MEIVEIQGSAEWDPEPGRKTMDSKGNKIEESNRRK